MKLHKRHRFPSIFKVSCTKRKYLSTLIDIYSSECKFEIGSYIECYKCFSVSKCVNVMYTYTHSNTRLFQNKSLHLNVI